MRPWFKAWWTTFRFRYVLLEMLVALALAFLIWLYAHSRAQDSIDRVQIPVQVQLAAQQRDQFLLEASGTPTVTVSFSGPSSRIRDLRRNLQRRLIQGSAILTIPDERLGETTFSESLRIDGSQIAVPPGVVVDVADDGCTIPVTVQRLGERQLPVKFDSTGDVRVTQLKLEPATVLVRGPKHILDRTQALQTQSFAFTVPATDTTDNMVRGQVALLAELEGRGITASPRLISFRCKVQPRQRIYELADVPVTFMVSAEFPWRTRFLEPKDGKVRLRLLGPAGEVDPPVRAFVDLTGASYFGAEISSPFVYNYRRILRSWKARRRSFRSISKRWNAR